LKQNTGGILSQHRLRLLNVRLNNKHKREVISLLYLFMNQSVANAGHPTVSKAELFG